MSLSWTTLNLGDVVFLSQGFEDFDTNSGSDYGLVVGRFKVKGSHSTNLMVATGTSIKPGYSIDYNCELIIFKKNGLLGKDTKFYFSSDYINIYEFPSEAFKASNRSSQELTTVIGSIENLNIELETIRSYNKGMKNLYYKILKEWNIDINSLQNISLKKPYGFLE